MSQTEKNAAYRRARINRLKKIIIRTMAAMLILPIFLCIFLFYKLICINKKIDLMNEKVLEYEELLKRDNIEDRGNIIIIKEDNFDWQNTEKHIVDIEK